MISADRYALTDGGLVTKKEGIGSLTDTMLCLEDENAREVLDGAFSDHQRSFLTIFPICCELVCPYSHSVPPF